MLFNTSLKYITWTKSSHWAWVKQSHLVFGYRIFQSLKAGILDLISLYIYISMESIFLYWEYILRIPLLVFTIQRLMIDIDNTDTSYFSVPIHEHLFLCSGGCGSQFKQISKTFILHTFEKTLPICHYKSINFLGKKFGDFHHGARICILESFDIILFR